MGRKKAAVDSDQPTTAATAPAAQEERSVNKMELVRQVLSANSDASPADIVSELAKQGAEINEKTASVYKSKINKASGEGRTRATRQQPKSGPTLDDLFDVRGWLDESGQDFDTARRQAEQLATLADKIGGLDNLKSCLDALEKLAK